MTGIGIVLAAALAGFADGGDQLTDEQRAALSRYFGFGPMEIYKFDPRGAQLRVTDLDGDGRTDIALWNGRKSRIEMLYQPSTTPPQAGAAAAKPDLERNEIPNRGNMRLESVPVAYKLAAMEIADVTGDKRPDIVFFGEPKEVVILPGKPGGGFGPAEGVRAPDGNPQGGSLAVGDYNGDGKTDVALLGPEILQIFHQKPEGGLAKPVRMAHGIKQPLMILTSDLDGNARDDLVITADEDDYGVYAYLQEERGALGALRRIRAPKLRSMTIVKPAPPQSGKGDDLFCVEAATGRLKQFRWQTPPEAGVAADWPQRLYSYPLKAAGKRRPVAVGDVTGDGIADVVAVDPEAAQVTLFAGTGSGLSSGTPFPGLLKATDVCIADFDGDGRNEVLSASEEEKMIGVSGFADGRLTFPSPLPIKGAPIALSVGSLKVGASNDALAYVTRQDRKLMLVVVPARGGEEKLIPLEDLEDDPSGVRFADANQDALNDLLVFVRFGQLETFLQNPDGSFTRFSGAETRPGLVKESSIEAFDLADVTGDGKPELVLGQKSFARALVIKDGRWTVVDQYNPESADAQVTGLTVLPGERGAPLIVLYERKARDVLVLKRREDGTYAVVQSMPVGNYDLTAMRMLPLEKLSAAGTSSGAGSSAGRAAVLIADAEKLATLTPNEKAPTLVEQRAYESKAKDAWLADAVVGDLNHDGIRDVVVVDMGKASLEILTTLPDGDFVNAQRFQVFQGKRFADAPDTRGEPREVLIGDVNGDKLDDIVLLVHDRVIVYPGQ